MTLEEAVDPIRTARLELVALTRSFSESVVAGERAAAAAAAAASVGSWLTRDASHVVQLHLAAQCAEAHGFVGLGRVVVLTDGGQTRRVIGTIGFHGPPDERGRLEVSCRISPAHRSRGYAAEALSALLDWATGRYGVTRFVVALPSRLERQEPVPIEVAARGSVPNDERIDHVGDLLESGPGEPAR